MILRVPYVVYKIVVADYLNKEDSIWSIKGFDYYLISQFPEIKELCSARLKRAIKDLA